MSLATKILEYNQNIEQNMFRKMPSVINKPLSEAQLRKIENFSVLGTIKEVNLLSELQLSQILKDNNVILPVGVSPSSAEAMIYIQQKLGELSQGRERTLTLNDLIGIQEQSGEKLQVKLENVGKQLETMNDMLAAAEGKVESKDEVEVPLYEKAGLPMATEAYPIIENIKDLSKRNIQTLKEYAKARGLGTPPTQMKGVIFNKDHIVNWIFAKQKGSDYVPSPKRRARQVSK